MPLPRSQRQVLRPRAVNLSSACLFALCSLDAPGVYSGCSQALHDSTHDEQCPDQRNAKAVWYQRRDDLFPHDPIRATGAEQFERDVVPLHIWMVRDLARTIERL